jgi:uncharacterized protein (DUF58 family)
VKKLKITSFYTTFLADGLIQIIIAGILATALIYKVTSIVLLCVCLLVLNLCAKAWTRVSLNKVEQDVKLSSKRAFPDDPVRVKVHVKNKKLLPVLMHVELQGKSMETLSQEAGLLSFSDYQFEWALTYPKRGVYSLGPLRLAAGDPLGFYSIGESDAESWEIVIYPQPVPFSPGAIKSEEFFGNYKGRSFVADPVLVEGARDYSPSRPAKNIHWMASAKVGVLQEKILDSSTHRKVVLVIDVRGFQEADAGDAFENMLGKVASCLMEYSKRGIFPGLMVNGVRAGRDAWADDSPRGANAVYKHLETLARLTMDVDPGRDEMMDAYQFKSTTSYLYFCHSSNEKVSALQNRNKGIRFIMNEEEGTQSV